MPPTDGRETSVAVGHRALSERGHQNRAVIARPNHGRDHRVGPSRTGDDVLEPAIAIAHQRGSAQPGPQAAVGSREPRRAPSDPMPAVVPDGSKRRKLNPSNRTSPASAAIQR